MIHCTRAAAANLDQVREQQGILSDFGVRLFAARCPQGEVGSGLELAPAPVKGGVVVEQFRTRLMVAPEVADQLGDVTLDVVHDPSPNGNGTAQLVIRLPGEQTT